MKHKFAKNIAKYSLLSLSGACITTGLCLSLFPQVKNGKTVLSTSQLKLNSTTKNESNATSSYIFKNYNPKYLFSFFNDKLKFYVNKDGNYESDIIFGLNLEYIGAVYYWTAMNVDTYDWTSPTIPAPSTRITTTKSTISASTDGFLTQTAKDVGWNYQSVQNLKACLDINTYSSISNIMAEAMSSGKLFIAPIQNPNNNYSSFRSQDKLRVFNVIPLDNNTSTPDWPGSETFGKKIDKHFYVNYYNPYDQNTSSAWKNAQNINYILSNPTIFTNQGLRIDNPSDWQKYINNLPLLKWKTVANNFGIGNYTGTQYTFNYAPTTLLCQHLYNLLINNITQSTGFGAAGKITFQYKLPDGTNFDSDTAKEIWGTDTPVWPQIKKQSTFDLSGKLNSLSDDNVNSQVNQTLISLIYTSDQLADSKKFCKYINKLVSYEKYKYLPYFYVENDIHYFSEWYSDFFVTSYADVLGKKTIGSNTFYQPHQLYGGSDTWTTQDNWPSDTKYHPTSVKTCTPIFIKPISIDSSDCSLPSVLENSSRLIPSDKKHIYTPSGQNAIYLNHDLTQTPSSSQTFASIVPQITTATGSKIVEYDTRCSTSASKFSLESFNNYLLSLSPASFKSFFDTGTIDTGSKLWGKVTCFKGLVSSYPAEGTATELSTAIPFFIDIQSEEITNIREQLDTDILENLSNYNCQITSSNSVIFNYNIKDFSVTESVERSEVSSDTISNFANSLTYAQTLNSCKDKAPKDVYTMDKNSFIELFISYGDKAYEYNTELFKTSLLKSNLTSNLMFAEENIPENYLTDPIVQLWDDPDHCGMQDPLDSKTSLTVKYNSSPTTVNCKMAFPYVLDSISQHETTYTWVDYNVSPATSSQLEHTLQDKGSKFEVKYYFGDSFFKDAESASTMWKCKLNWDFLSADTADNKDVTEININDVVKLSKPELLTNGIEITKDNLKQDEKGLWYLSVEIELLKEWLNVNMLAFNFSASRVDDPFTYLRKSSNSSGMILNVSNPATLDETKWTTTEETKCFRAQNDKINFAMACSDLFKTKMIHIFDEGDDHKITPLATFQITTKSDPITLSPKNWTWVEDIKDDQGTKIGCKITGTLVQTKQEGEETVEVNWFTFTCSQYSKDITVENKTYKNSYTIIEIIKNLDEKTTDPETGQEVLSPTYGHLNMSYTIGDIGAEFKQSWAMGEADPDPVDPQPEPEDPTKSWWTKSHIAGISMASGGAAALVLSFVALGRHNKNKKKYRK